MNNIFIVLLVGLSLSMDAFSLAFGYGAMNISTKKGLTIALTVGIAHFIMPLLGSTFGLLLQRFLFGNLRIVMAIIMAILAIEFLIESQSNNNKSLLLSLLGIILFAITVSLDSFTIGIGIKTFNVNSILCCLIFTIFSFIFTLVGIKLGKLISNSYGNKAKILGGLILLALSVFYIIKS